MTDSEKDREDGATPDQTEADPSASPSDAPKGDTITSDSGEGDEAPDSSADDDEDDDGDEQESAAAAPAKSESSSGPSALLIGVLCLGLGVGGGWMGKQYQTSKAEKTADASVQGAGDAARGACKDWETKLCSDLGDSSFGCVQAKAASPLLSGSTCAQATKTLAASVAKMKLASASCDKLRDKLCGELGADSQSCGLVKAQTPSFPPQKCDEMMANYDQVLGQLKMMEQRGGMPGMRPPQGHPGAGGPPPGHPPGGPSSMPPGPGH